MRISPVHFPLIGIVLLFATMGLLAWLVIGPLKTAIRTEMDDIQKFHADRENQKRQIDKLPELRDQFQAIEKDEQHVGLLLSEEHIVDFVKTLEELARATETEIVIRSKGGEQGNAIVEKKPAKAPARQPGKEDEAAPEEKGKKEPTLLEAVPYDRYLHVDIVVTGTYNAIVLFLRKMETLPYALDVVAMNIRFREEVAKTEVPDARSNPFMLSPGSGALVPDAQKQPTVPDAPPTEALRNALVATFETAVYIRKKE